MARTKKAPRTVTLPDPLPAGLIIAKVPKKLHGKDGPTTTLEVLAPEETGEGIIAYQKFYESVRVKEGKNADPDANTLTARAILALATKSQEVLAKAKDENGNAYSGFAFPKAPRTRVLDPMDAYLEAQRVFIQKNRRPPTNEETAKMYAEFFS